MVKIRCNGIVEHKTEDSCRQNAGRWTHSNRIILEITRLHIYRHRGKAGNRT